METLNWKNNTTFEDTITVQQAIDLLIFESKDNGKMGAVMVMPSTSSYKDWNPVLLTSFDDYRLNLPYKLDFI